MKVSVDRAVCTGHAMCALICPEVFVLDERGYCDVPDDCDVPDEHRDAARRAVDSCPEGALFASDDD